MDSNEANDPSNLSPEEPGVTWATSEAVWRVYGDLPTPVLRSTELMAALDPEPAVPAG